MEGFAISKESCTTVARGGIAIAVQDPEASRPPRFSFSRESNATRAFSALSVTRSKLEGIVIFVLTTSTLRMRVHIYMCVWVCIYVYSELYLLLRKRDKYREQHDITKARKTNAMLLDSKKWASGIRKAVGSSYVGWALNVERGTRN